MKLLSDLDVAAKRVFLRADLDVPLETQDGKRLTTNAVQDTATRLFNLKPTIDYLLEQGARQIIIAGHIDRPEKPDPALSTKNLADDLEKILSRSVTFKPDFSPASGTLASIAQLVLLENLRFWPGEVANDPDFAQQLELVADIYINEAFGNCHRAHASMVALPALLPHGAGLHLQKEIEVLSKFLESPERPFVAIVGGAKIETKVPVIDNLAKIADFVLVGGEIALEIQNSKFKVQNANSKIRIAKLTSDTKDIDEESVKRFEEIIKGAKTIVWNGPMGIFEEGHDRGTLTIAQAIIDSGAYSVVGGGDTTQFLASKNLLTPPVFDPEAQTRRAGGFSFVSSGGGAMLEFLSGKELPGIVALS